jgi:hypothetical protein
LWSGDVLGFEKELSKNEKKIVRKAEVHLGIKCDVVVSVVDQ